MAREFVWLITIMVGIVVAAGCMGCVVMLLESSSDRFKVGYYGSGIRIIEDTHTGQMYLVSQGNGITPLLDGETE